MQFIYLFLWHLKINKFNNMAYFYALVCIYILQEPVKRILGLTETCLIERDPQTYSIVTLRPLSSVSIVIFFKVLLLIDIFFLTYEKQICTWVPANIKHGLKIIENNLQARKTCDFVYYGKKITILADEDIVCCR